MSYALSAQEVKGFWKGTLDMLGGCFGVNHIELQVTIEGTVVSGFSYHFLDVNNYVRKTFVGSYDPRTKKLMVQEGIVTTFKIPQNCVICVKKYELVYEKRGNQEYLVGTWTGKIRGTTRDCDVGTIQLSRIAESNFRDVPEPSIAQIPVDTDSIRLDFYDNGTIDGDSITVRVNGRTVLTHEKLGAKPVTVYVLVSPQQWYQEVEMVAENLGSIPPNTALLIITAGKKRYRLFLSSSKTNSAAVRFIYEPSAPNLLE
jgi:hypothetical protein